MFCSTKAKKSSGSSTGSSGAKKNSSFELLKNEAFFKAVYVCQTGGGGVWDENRDLAA